jgi:hydroxymethylbilane synthase
VAPLEHAATRAAAMAERAVSRGLGGSCEVPLAAYAQIERGELRLRALVGNHRTGEFVEANVHGAPQDGEAIAAEAVAKLKAAGALALLAG